jgi:glycosyltransferase involved in cell wall biosynthesis
MTNLFFLVPDLSPCGEAAAAWVLARGLPRDRFNVAVGVLGPVAESQSEELRRSGDIPVQSVPIRHVFDLSGARRLRQAVRESATAVIHAWGPWAARLSRLIVTGSGEGGNTPRLIVSGATFPGSGLGGWLTARQIRRADRVVPATWAEGERYRRFGVRTERLTRIGPAAPARARVPDADALLRSLSIPPGSRLVVTGAKAERGIGPKDAIVAFDMLRYDARDLHLVVFGAGSAALGLEQFGRALAFDDFRIRFSPTATDRPATVQLATVVLVTDSRSGAEEALEAMAAGKPVVGWNTPDLTEIVDDGATGFLVPVGDRAALASKTRLLLDDPKVAAQMGEAGRLRVAERFTAARMVEQFGRLYTEVAT